MGVSVECFEMWRKTFDCVLRKGPPFAAFSPCTVEYGVHDFLDYIDDMSVALWQDC